MALAEQIELACLMEATARKPGNVHPAAAFSDLCHDDFVRAAAVIAKPLARSQPFAIGRVIHDSVVAMRNVTDTNVNLGIILLLAPLVAVPGDVSLEEGIEQVLQSTTVEDAEWTYAAIRLANPGGLGQADSQDVADRPTMTLRAAMGLAADRDRIAEQYDTGFRLVFEARRQLSNFWQAFDDWESAIVALQIWILARWDDTLIARKCGWPVAREASRLAGELMLDVEQGRTLDARWLGRFDAWLRADGHRRNPGTTADLIAATLFAGLRDKTIVAPSRQEIVAFAAKMSGIAVT